MKRLFSLCLLLTLVLSSAATTSAAPRQREECFPTTGFCVSGPILDYWQRNGGLAVFGYPISDLQNATVEGSWSGPLQWFERDRLEDHSAEGLGVLAGRLGARALELQGRPWQSFPTINENDSPVRCSYYPQTRHNMCAPFENYWAEQGGLARFGYPITQPFEEEIEGKTYLVQYFERRRMEYHPENADPRYKILLGLLGRDVYESDPAPPSTPDQFARTSAVQFFSLLNAGKYREAAAFYGGDYRELRAYNADITADPTGNPDVQGQLWQRACTVNGYLCLQPRKVVVVSRRSSGDYLVALEFSNSDGSLFRHPNYSSTAFQFRVARQGGQYVVLDLPLYQS